MHGKLFVDEMRMPPWASNSYDLTRTMRTELESQYVRDNIHQWIDLIFGVDQKNPNKYNLFFPIVYPDYHTNNRVAILAKDEHPDDRIEMQKNMIMNMSEMFIMPPRLFSANLKQIITKKQKKQETNQQKQNMIMKNDLMGGFGDDKLAAATSM